MKERDLYFYSVVYYKTEYDMRWFGVTKSKKEKHITDGFYSARANNKSEAEAKVRACYGVDLISFKLLAHHEISVTLPK